MVSCDVLFMHDVDMVDTFLELLQLGTIHHSSIFLTYLAYHIWLTWNAIIFSSSRCSTKMIIKRARAHTEVYQILIAMITETWDFGLALRALHRVFISWEFPPPRFFTISFDGSIRDRRGSATFVIHGSGLGFLVAGDCHFLDPTISMAEIRDAWADILCTQRTLLLDQLIIESDSATMISWIR